jgi:hypothetical protein
MSTFTQSSYHGAMLATSFRPRFAVLSVLVVATLAIAAWPRGRAGCECPHRRMSLPQSVALAEAHYRAGDFLNAKYTLQRAAAGQPIEKAEELHVIASFYEQLWQADTLAQAAVSSEGLWLFDRAIQFDGMLGGAHTQRLETQRHRLIATVGPQ